MDTLTLWRPKHGVTPTSGSAIANLYFRTPDACLDAIEAFVRAGLSRGLHFAGHPFYSPVLGEPAMEWRIACWEVVRGEGFDGPCVRASARWQCRPHRVRRERVAAVIDGVECVGVKEVVEHLGDWQDTYLDRLLYGDALRTMKTGATWCIEAKVLHLGEGIDVATLALGAA